MTYETVTTLLLLLLALLSGAFVACLLRRWMGPSSPQASSKPREATAGSRTASSNQNASTSSLTASAVVSSPNQIAPDALSAPRQNNPDDLQRINGIGKKLELKLNDLGVYHYDQIAKWYQGNVAWVDDHLSFKGRIDREEWIPQASDLAQGKATVFSKAYDNKHKRKSTTRKPNKTVASKRVPAKKAPAKKPVQARGLKAAIGGKADDLKTISGVGPKLEKTLNELGIFHFEQIASWKAKDIVEVDDLLSFKGRIKRDDWIAQAKKLMKK